MTFHLGREVVDVGENGDCLFEAARVQYQSIVDTREAFMQSAQALRHQIAAWYRDNRMVLTKRPDLSALAPDAQNLTKWESICKQITEPGVW